MFHPPSPGSFVRALCVTALMALGSGCYAEADAEPVYVDATVAPVDIEMAPSYYYEGRTVYYVNDHWYARDRGHWVYYRSEPAPLARYRVQVQRAPRAPERVEVQRAPRATERFEDGRGPRRPERSRPIERSRRDEAPRAEPRREAPHAERVE